MNFIISDFTMHHAYHFITIGFLSGIMLFLLKKKLTKKIIQPIIFFLIQATIFFALTNNTYESVVCLAVIVFIMSGVFIVYHDQIIDYQYQSKLKFEQYNNEKIWSNDLIKAHLYAEQKNIKLNTVLYTSHNILIHGIKIHAPVEYRLLKTIIDGTSHTLLLTIDSSGYIHAIDTDTTMNNFQKNNESLILTIDHSTKTFSCATRSEEKQLLSPGQAMRIISSFGEKQK